KPVVDVRGADGDAAIGRQRRERVQQCRRIRATGDGDEHRRAAARRVRRVQGVANGAQARGRHRRILRKPPLTSHPASREGCRREPLRTETADGVRHIVLTRAAEYNTITPALRDELARAIDDADVDHDVRVILLRAEGPAFCAGYGLDWSTT